MHALFRPLAALAVVAASVAHAQPVAPAEFRHHASNLQKVFSSYQSECAAPEYDARPQSQQAAEQVQREFFAFEKCLKADIERIAMRSARGLTDAALWERLDVPQRRELMDSLGSANEGLVAQANDLLRSERTRAEQAVDSYLASVNAREAAERTARAEAAGKADLPAVRECARASDTLDAEVGKLEEREAKLKELGYRISSQRHQVEMARYSSKSDYNWAVIQYNDLVRMQQAQARNLDAAVEAHRTRVESFNASCSRRSFSNKALDEVCASGQGRSFCQAFSR